MPLEQVSHLPQLSEAVADHGLSIEKVPHSMRFAGVGCVGLEV